MTTKNMFLELYSSCEAKFNCRKKSLTKFFFKYLTFNEQLILKVMFRMKPIIFEMYSMTIIIFSNDIIF